MKKKLSTPNHIDNIVAQFAPIWFDWVNWLFLVGTLSFLLKKTQNPYIFIILMISNFLLFIHLTKFFEEYELKRIPFVKNRRAIQIISILLTSGIGFFCWKMFESIIPSVENLCH